MPELLHKPNEKAIQNNEISIVEWCAMLDLLLRCVCAIDCMIMKFEELSAENQSFKPVDPFRAVRQRIKPLTSRSLRFALRSSGDNQIGHLTFGLSS